MTPILAMRHRVTRIMRDHLDALGFVEIETPLLDAVDARRGRGTSWCRRGCGPGTFFALPQSPQQLKQLLMVAGQDRYYQIVRCLRDEATARRPRLRVHAARRRDVVRRRGGRHRGDRAAVRADTSGRRRASRSPTPFPRMTYEEMVDRFGSDKADLRYDLELVSLADLFAGTGFNAFASVRAPEGGAIKAIRAPGGRRSQPQGARQARRGREGPRRRGPRLDRRRARRGVRSPVAKFLSDEERDGVVARDGRVARRPRLHRGRRAGPGERRARRPAARPRGSGWT